MGLWRPWLSLDPFRPKMKCMWHPFGTPCDRLGPFPTNLKGAAPARPGPNRAPMGPIRAPMGPMGPYWALLGLYPDINPDINSYINSLIYSPVGPLRALKGPARSALWRPVLIDFARQGRLSLVKLFLCSLGCRYHILLLCFSPNEVHTRRSWLCN